jgi:two-component system cell cycle sensor histidine kinase/response regulator CckA
MSGRGDNEDRTTTVPAGAGGPRLLFVAAAIGVGAAVAALVASPLVAVAILLGCGGVAAYYERILAANAQAFERLEQEREQRKAAEKGLIEGQKMELVGRLAGGVAHDFNNSLLVIMTWCDILRTRQMSTTDRDEALASIAQAAARAAQLTRQLLAFGKGEVQAPKPTDVGPLLTDIGKTVERLFPANILVTIEAESLPRVTVDEGQLHQVLLNLAINARDAMPNGGTLAFSATARGEDEVEIVVRDTGTGMDAPTMQRLFEPFFTTKGDGRGTGLGLTTVKRIVEEYGSTIRVRSVIGKGTTFTIVFPVAKHRETSRPPPLDVFMVGGATILLVDDEEPAREAMVHTLRGVGFQVLAADDPARALEIARRHRGDIHLLCTDGVLPGMGTSGLVDAFRQLFPGAPVLVCSGHIQADVLRARIREGEYAFLAKPFSAAALVDKVQATLSREGRPSGVLPSMTVEARPEGVGE